jgi:hypothetical protein
MHYKIFSIKTDEYDLFESTFNLTTKKCVYMCIVETSSNESIIAFHAEIFLYAHLNSSCKI